MKKIFRNVLLATTVAVSFGPIYAYALDDLVVNILDHLPDAPTGQSSIVNIGVNTADIDAFVKISGESIAFTGSQTQGSTGGGTGVMGNSLGEGISWGNSIETSAIGANVTTNFIGAQSVSATLDLDYKNKTSKTEFNLNVTEFDSCAFGAESLDLNYEKETSKTRFDLDVAYHTYYPSIINVAYNTADIDASVQIGKSYTQDVSIQNLHTSTQAVGVNSVINVANTYQMH
jgi:hypothetical protein